MARSLKLRLTDEFDDVRSKVMRDPRPIVTGKQFI